MILESTSIFEDDFQSVRQNLDILLRSTNANSAFLIDRAGQLITSVGSTFNIDMESFCSLSAADFAATGQLASLVGETEFSTLFHQGELHNIYISTVGQRVILAVLFDSRSNLGLVRLRVRQASEHLAAIFNRIFGKVEAQSRAPHLDENFAREAEDELDRLLG